MNPDGSMGTLLGPAQCVTANCCWTSQIPAGSCWIWQPGVTNATWSDLQGAYFTKRFDVLCPPTDGQIHIAADDFAEVQVNGAVVGSIGSVTDYGLAAAAQAGLVEFDLSPFLTNGMNTIIIRQQNGPSSFAAGCNPCTFYQNPTGVVFGGYISYSTATPAQRTSLGAVKTLYR